MQGHGHADQNENWPVIFCIQTTKSPLKWQSMHYSEYLNKLEKKCYFVINVELFVTILEKKSVILAIIELYFFPYSTSSDKP